MELKYYNLCPTPKTWDGVSYIRNTESQSVHSHTTTTSKACWKAARVLLKSSLLKSSAQLLVVLWIPMKRDTVFNIVQDWILTCSNIIIEWKDQASNSLSHLLFKCGFYQRSMQLQKVWIYKLAIDTCVKIVHVLSHLQMTEKLFHGQNSIFPK